MKELKAVIAEDEPVLAREISDEIARAWPELEICAVVADGIQAIQAIDIHRPSVLFLDIKMPGTSGLEVAQYASGRAHVVFVTAYDSYAVSAFEQGAVDYLLKPVSAERLRLTVERLRERMLTAPSDLAAVLQVLKTVTNPSKRYLRWLTVPQGNGLRVIATDDIHFLRADHKYVEIHTHDASYLLSHSLKDLQAKLDPEQFWQVHRSFIVNVNAVDAIYRSFRGTLEIKVKGGKDLIPVSAAHAHRFRGL